MATKDWKCPFCGSKKLVLDSPYVDIHKQKITSYCCKAQALNQKYAESRRNPWQTNEKQLTPEEVSRL